VGPGFGFFPFGFFLFPLALFLIFGVFGRRRWRHWSGHGHHEHWRDEDHHRRHDADEPRSGSTV
jgi:hypothetical protein